VVKEVLALKWGGLFLGYLLGKNFRRNDDACGGERAADPLHCPGIDSELFGNDTHTGSPGAARAYLNSLRHLRSSLLRRLAPSGLELRANSLGAFSGFHEATPLTSSAERATGVT
jgi:hypothetical protein